MLDGAGQARRAADSWNWVCLRLTLIGLFSSLASHQFGLRVFDSSVAGLGGCPYAKGATGNVATEDVVHLLHGLGEQTGIDLAALTETAVWISGLLGKASSSRVASALSARR